MRFADLDAADVAVWGGGREGRSVLAALGRRLPGKSLTVYCSPDEVRTVCGAYQGALAAGAPGRSDEGPPPLAIRTQPPDADALASHDVVIKSPGISAYRPELLAAQERGTRFTSGTALWFGENVSGTHDDARVVAVTGTKGKSTTTAMIAHCRSEERRVGKECRSPWPPHE